MTAQLFAGLKTEQTVFFIFVAANVGGQKCLGQSANCCFVDMNKSEQFNLKVQTLALADDLNYLF